MQRTLKIAQVAPPWTSVPPKKYGGAELIVSYITEELMKRGHKVTLYASGDSKTSATLRSVYKKALFSQGITMSDVSIPLLTLFQAVSESKKFDVIHSHIHAYDQFFIPFSNAPWLATLHSPTSNSEANPTRASVFEQFKRHNFVSISLRQRKAAPARMHFIDNIYNGIKVGEFMYNEKPKNHFIWIARFAAKKGAWDAIQVAKKSRTKLVLAGTANSEDEKQYFANNIKPHINKSSIKFIGEISRSQKSHFFKNAKALLNPIQWDEPFGLTMIEAMACGTPVIAYNRGSVPEIIKHGITGYVVKNKQQMYKAIKKIITLPDKQYRAMRQSCRKHVEKNFTMEKMVDGYEQLYYKMLKQ